jgi:ABC-type phosphate transport system substrate-binding protein
MRKLMRIVVGATALAGGVALAVGPAMADPINGSGKAVVPRATDIVGVGADTSANVFDQFAVDYNKTISSTKPHLYTWDATNPKTGAVDDPIKTKSGCSAIQRPDGASTGITALTANTKVSGHKSDYCIDFARSSSGRSTQLKGPGGVVFVELGKDAITWATNAKTNAPANLSTAQLAAIYSCTDKTWNNVGGKSTATIKPFLPLTGSGLRKSFLKDIGVATPGSCVNSSVVVNEGTDPQFKNNANALVPYSVAKYLSQVYRSAKCGRKPTKSQNLFGCDQHGSFVLHSINGTAPTSGKGSSQTINKTFTAGFFNTIYDVVRWASTKDNIPAYLESLFGAKGWLCKSSTAKKDLLNYKLLPTPLCGIGS